MKTYMTGDLVTIEELERAHIEAIIESSRTLDEAAQVLGIDPATLYRKRRKYETKPETYELPFHLQRRLSNYDRSRRHFRMVDGANRRKALKGRALDVRVGPQNQPSSVRLRDDLPSTAFNAQENEQSTKPMKFGM